VGDELKAGDRLRSAVCDTEVVVVKVTDGTADVRCGGVTMLPAGQEPTADDSVLDGFGGGTLIGKRYTDGDNIELLCTKAGNGSLSVGETVLDLKGAKPLPSSD
jgi:hypothetical protein